MSGRPYAVIRLPRFFLVYIVVFSVVWCGGVLVGLVAAFSHASAVALIPLGMLAFGAALFYRMFRLSVELRQSELVVRNFFRTIRVSRDTIEGFRIGPTAGQPFSQAIHVLVRGDQLVPLDVTVRPSFFGWGNYFFDRRLAELRAWQGAS